MLINKELEKHKLNEPGFVNYMQNKFGLPEEHEFDY